MGSTKKKDECSPFTISKKVPSISRSRSGRQRRAVHLDQRRHLGGDDIGNLVIDLDARRSRSRAGRPRNDKQMALQRLEEGGGEGQDRAEGVRRRASICRMSSAPARAAISRSAPEQTIAARRGARWSRCSLLADAKSQIDEVVLVGNSIPLVQETVKSSSADPRRASIRTKSSPTRRAPTAVPGERSPAGDVKDLRPRRHSAEPRRGDPRRHHDGDDSAPGYDPDAEEIYLHGDRRPASKFLRAQGRQPSAAITPSASSTSRASCRRRGVAQGRGDLRHRRERHSQRPRQGHASRTRRSPSRRRQVQTRARFKRW